MGVNKIISAIDQRKNDADLISVSETIETENRPITANRIASLLQEMGYRGKVIHGDNWCWVESSTNGVVFSVYSFSDKLADPDREGRSIQFDGGWGGLSAYDARRLLMACNRFNHDWRYAKATVVADKDRHSLTVKLDHHCPNGLADKEFYDVAEMFIRLFEDMAKRMAALAHHTLSAIVKRHNEAIGLMWGSEGNPQEALEICLENAHCGYGGSMISLGDLYEHGAEVCQSAETAAYFFARAAERGQPSAYYGLARVLSESTPDEAILVEATKYALLAVRDLPDGPSKRGAEMLRDNLMTKLSDDVRETALRLASDWEPLNFEGGPIENSPLHDGIQAPPSSVLN